MKNFNYFILNQIKSNPDGEPTVNRQSRLMLHRCYLRNLAMLFAILTLSIANIGTAWGESVTATYSHSSSSFNPVAFTTNDYFSAMTIATNGTVGGGTKTGARCNLNGNTNTTITFTYTAKSSFKLTSFNLNSFVNSDNVKNSVITYYKNSETPTELSPAIIFDKSDSSPSDKSSSTINESLNNGDVFTIKVSINNSTGTARQWYINTITLYLTATPPCTARTFKSGEKIFFKDASGSISGLNEFWKKEGNDIYAYFYDSNDGAEAVWSTYGNCVTGAWNVANAIYEFTVPQYNSADHTWTGVIFTRGSGAEWGSTTHQTSDQQPCADQNMYIQNTSAAVDGKYNGSWGVYSNGPAIVGGMNNWLPDGGVLNFSGSTGTVIMNLEGSTSYQFKILEGTTWFGNNGTITSSIESGSSWTFATDKNNCTITTGEAGEYVFKWDNTNKKLWVSYPGDRLRKNTYLYFDASYSTNWQSAEFDTKFYFVYYDTNDGVETKFGDDRISDTSYPWVFYTTVPDNDYVGKVQIMRMKDGDHSTQWNYANMTNANTRSSALQNCVYITEAQASWEKTQTLQWKTYCPPMSSAALNDNSTTVIAGTSGNGSVGNPYIVPTSGTIQVQAAATSAVPDPAMTKMFDFKVDNNSQQNSTATTYSKGSLSNNTVYQISVDAYNTYNETNGTKKTPDMLFYKALNQYSVTIEKTGVTKSSGAEGSNAVVHTYADYVAVFAASSGYTLPATVTVMRGGSDITANCAWDQGVGTLTIPAAQITGNITITVTGVATTTITIDANTSNHGSTAPSPITATYGSALPSFTPAAGIGGWNLTGYFTEATSGTKVINADGTLVAGTDYADGDGKWKYETATLKLYAQYEEEGCTPTTLATVTLTGGDSELSVATNGCSESHSLENSKGVGGKIGKSGYLDISGLSLKAGDKVSVSIKIGDYSASALYMRYGDHESSDIQSAATGGSAGSAVVVNFTVTKTATAISFARATGSTTGTASIDNQNHILKSITITRPCSEVYTITEGSHTNGTIAITDDEDNTITEAEEGATVHISATPNTGYNFTSWSVTKTASGDAISLTGTNPATFTMPAEAVTVAATFSPASYTVTLNTNDGAINADNVTSYTYGTGATLPTNVTKDGFTFGGWYDNSGLTGSPVTTISTTATGNKEYWAKWECVSLTVNRGGTEATPAEGEPLGTAYGTLTCSATTGVIASYQWKQNTIGSKDGAVNAVGEGATTANFSPKPTAAGSYWYYCVATDECGNEVETGLSGMFRFNAASLTALECNTLYKAEHMVASSITSFSSTEQFAGGLSSNARFEVLGTGNANATGGPMGAKNDGVTISETTFTNCLYFKGAGNKSGEIPTSRGIKFIVGTAGILDIYCKGPGSIVLVKEGGTGSAIGSGDSNAKVSKAVTAGTYYLYASANSRTLFGIQLNCCTTPAAPTEFTAGSITSTGATFTITDEANAASYDIYYSTSNSAPDAGKAATTTSTEKTKSVTGLTANTTYYAWVRSVCDADHKSAWVALAGSSFKTSAAEATPILSWAIGTNTSSWSATPTNNDATNLTNVATFAENAAVQSGTSSGKSCKLSLSSSATPDKYVTFTFNVACGKKLTPSSIWMQVANVGNTSGGKMTHKAEISDTYGHSINATVIPATDGTLNTLEITNGGGTYLQGAVTLKVWAWNSTSGGNGSAFRMGPNVKIFGEVASQASPAATITWNTQPANGQVGDPDFAYDVTCSDGSAVTVTSANTTYATIVGGKLHYAAAGTTYLVATATDACGNKVEQNSDNFIVSAAAPVIKVQPTLSEVTLGETASFSLTAIGATSYQWYRCDSEGENRVEASGASATIANYSYTTTATGTTYYICKVSNASGDTWSDVVGSIVTPVSFTIHYEAGSTDKTTYTTETFTQTKEVNAEVADYIGSLTKFAFTGVEISDKGKDGTMSMKISMPTSEDAGKYVSFTFTVAPNYYLSVDNIDIQCQPVGNANHNYKVVLTDALGTTITGTSSTNTKGELNSINFPAAQLSGKRLVGLVTVKIFGWYSSSDTYRLAKNTYITGTVSSLPALTFVSSDPANGATDVATSGTIVLTFSEALGSVDESKFTLTGATKGTVNIDGSDATKVNITYTGAANSSTVTLATAAAAVSDVAGNALAAALSNISFTTAAAAPATKDIYYGAITITAGALTKGSTGVTQFFTNIGGTVANNTEISLSSTPSTTGMYYNSNNLTDTELSKSSNWSTSSGSNRYIRGLKFVNGTTYTLALGTKVASAITFYGWCGSISKVMTIGGEGYTSSSTKNTFAKHEFTKSGGFTGNVSITETGDFYGILVITIQTAAPCTTPTLPTLSNQEVCEGSDIVEWDATQTAVLKDGETVTYSWKKKGNDTELTNTASFDLGSSATEAMAGTYVVTATVSADGKASKSATKEVTLTVNEATEVTAITADKATVYPTNSVTLTATANMDATWQWYTCTNAEGAGESPISGATSASYTIASAPDAGTYYYKVKATGSCGIAERVYTLTVSAAAGGDCFHYVSVLPDKDISPSSGASIVTPTYATTLEGGTMKVGSSQVTITKNGLKLESAKYVSITLDAALEAGNVVIVKGSTATAGNGVTINGVNFYESDSKTFDVSYTVTADDGLVGKTALTVTKYNGSSYLQEIKITGCGEACTDPEVTASVDNSTACVGTSVTFTATGAHAEATYQWQKYSGGAWTDIADADAATYNIPSVATTDAMKYRVIAHHDCGRTSNEVTLSVPVAPAFADFTATRTVMATQALSITDVEASDATSYAWYKSADATYDAGTDTKVGTSKELMLASGGEAAGDTYYLFCVASNACGSTTSGAITVTVTALIEEDCATQGNEGAADFGFTKENGVGESSVSSQSCWTSGGRAYYLTYSAPTGKYLKEAKVTVASSKDSKCGYAYSTDNGTNWTYAELTGLSTTLTEKTIDLSGKNVTDFRIGRNLQDGSSKDWGSTSGTFYLSKICFEYSNACTATTVTPSTASTSYEIGGAWSNPTFTLSVAGTLTYSSSDEEIALVDESGNVTFNDKAGTVTITAAYAGNATYCASEGSYTITVSCQGDAPKIVADGSVNMSGCNSSITLNAKKQDGTSDFTGGSYQWFRNGTEISGATSSSYTATQTGVYTVEYTSAGGCTSPSTNSATVTSDNVEPEVTKLVPFHYYHVDKNYSAQMKDRHLFSVTGSAAYGSTGKNFKLTMSRNSGEAVDMTTATSIFVKKSGDGQVDTVMIDLNKLSGKYSEGDELVLTCAAVDCKGNVSAVYKDEITIHVIGAKPTLALICSGSSKAGGTRKTDELTVGGDFLTGYNKADLCQQTSNTTFDANIEWGLYTRLKEKYIVTPVNGYAVFNKLNYEPFDILLLTDYPKASKSPAAATVLDDMADLCDYRPMLSFKTHMVAKSPSKWAAKGFTTSPVVTKADGRLNLNIVCYAHPMFASLQTGDDVYKDHSDLSQLVYTMLSEPGYESSKGMQGFEIAAAENFVTIGLTHYNASIATNSPSEGKVTWTPNDGDRMLVTVAERQTNIEARFILFSLNCGAQSKLTEKGEDVILACLKYLLDDDPLHVADCSLTFDNGAGNTTFDAETYTGSGVPGDGKWSTEANWGPQYLNIPGEFNSARIAAPVTVDMEHAKAMELRIIDEGRITIPAGKALQVKSTIRRMDGSEIYPTEISDIHIGSASTGNGTLIFDNNSGDTKARVDMYSKGFIDHSDPAKEPKGVKNYQYIGTPFIEVNALYNYYGSWIYYWGTKTNGKLGWVAVKNGGPMTAWTGYCITQEAPTYYQMSGTLAATGTVDINVPADANMVVGNSWTAPIDINALTTDDLEGLTASIYFFNTGVDKTGTAGPAGSRYAGSTYVTIPVEAARYVGEDDHINSLQGFFVKNTGGSAGTLHLDYERHVRKTTRGSIIGDALHAPARRTALSSDEPTVLKIKVSGENYDDKLLLLEREDFTEGFDNGWDGDKWDGNESALYIYTTDSEGTENSVSAIPELEGTIIGFRAGEDDAYTLNFEYLNSDEPIYLYDVENNTYTQIMTGMTYRFFTTDNEKHARFIITRSNGQEVATGVGEVPSDQIQGTKAKKLLIGNKMFIMVNGMLYDATGKVVK